MYVNRKTKTKGDRWGGLRGIEELKELLLYIKVLYVVENMLRTQEYMCPAKRVLDGIIK